MTWSADTEGTRRAEWVVGFDRTIRPYPADLTEQERADFVIARDGWIDTAERFMTAHAVSVSGHLLGWREPSGALHVSVPLDVRDEAPS